MMSKNKVSTFAGEGNPTDPIVVEAPVPKQRTVTVEDDEAEVLRRVLDRDRTAAVVHGGLKGLLGLSDWETAVLSRFLKKI